MHSFSTQPLTHLRARQKKGVSPDLHKLNPVYYKNLLVPEGGIEPPPAQGRLDFESSASTSFTTPALSLMFYYTKSLKRMSI